MTYSQFIFKETFFFFFNIIIFDRHLYSTNLNAVLQKNPLHF